MVVPISALFQGMVSEMDLTAGWERNLTRIDPSLDASEIPDVDKGSSSTSSISISISCRLLAGGIKEGRVRVKFLEANVFNAVLARSSTKGMSRTLLTTCNVF